MSPSSFSPDAGAAVLVALLPAAVLLNVVLHRRRLAGRLPAAPVAAAVTGSAAALAAGLLVHLI